MILNPTIQAKPSAETVDIYILTRRSVKEVALVYGTPEEPFVVKKLTQTTTGVNEWNKITIEKDTYFDLIYLTNPGETPGFDVIDIKNHEHVGINQYAVLTSINNGGALHDALAVLICRFQASCSYYLIEQTY